MKKQKAYEYTAAQVSFSPLERLEGADVTPCSLNGVETVCNQKRRQVISRCLRGCKITARSFSLRCREPGCSDDRPVESSGSEVGNIKTGSFQRWKVESYSLQGRMIHGDAQGSEHSLDGSKTLNAQQPARQGRQRCDIRQGGGGAACARGFDDAHAAPARRVVGGSQAHIPRSLQRVSRDPPLSRHAAASTVTHLATCRELDLEGERLPVNRPTARRNAAACTPPSNTSRSSGGNRGPRPINL
jgi:hypothetical protein